MDSRARFVPARLNKSARDLHHGDDRRMRLEVEAAKRRPVHLSCEQLSPPSPNFFDHISKHIQGLTNELTEFTTEALHWGDNKGSRASPRSPPSKPSSPPSSTAVSASNVGESVAA
eukprot:jgi/Chlat1/4205/Chrsp27S04294